MVTLEQALFKEASLILPESVEQEVDMVDRILSLAKEKLPEATQGLHELEQRRERLKLEVHRKELITARLSEIAKELQRSEERITKLREEYDTVSLELNRCIGSIQGLKKELRFVKKEEAEAAVRACKAELSILQEELTAAESALRNCELGLGRIGALLTDHIGKHNSLSVDCSHAKELYEQRLFDGGFLMGGKADEAAYREAVLTEEELLTLKNSLDSYHRAVEALNNRILQLKKNTEGREEQDLNQLLFIQEDWNKQSQEVGNQLSLIFSRLKNNEVIYRRVGEQNQQQEKLRREYLMISGLSRTASGELSGKSKLAFEQYVQAFYFEKVIHEANKRFYQMSNHQYVLQRKKEATDLRSSAGLELEVMDYYTGKARSVKSLSGGESFKAALSLALGLSDVIQSYAGGIEMDAMFVDEGFGSLDSDSLEQAIEALSALTAGNRIVGIISHVSELKERIDKKLLVEKSLEGSRLKLVK